MAIKTFVISLARSIDRRKNVSNQLSIPFDFINAIDAQEQDFLYSDRPLPKITKKKFGYTLTQGEVACFASHLYVWKKILELNKPVLVLEDNVEITEYFSEGYKQLELLAQKYDHIKLFAIKKHTPILISKINKRISIVRYRRKSAGTTGYVITPKAAQAFIDNAHHFIEPVDEYMSKSYKHGITEYAFYPDIVIRSDSPSVIGKDRKAKGNLTFLNKLYLELFRFYERVKN